MKQWFLLAVITILSLAFALIPEFTMYAIWHLVSPATEVGKIALIAIFAVAGTGVSILFGVMGIGLWASLVKEL